MNSSHCVHSEVCSEVQNSPSTNRPSFAAASQVVTRPVTGSTCLGRFRPVELSCVELSSVQFSSRPVTKKTYRPFTHTLRAAALRVVPQCVAAHERVTIRYDMLFQRAPESRHESA